MDLQVYFVNTETKTGKKLKPLDLNLKFQGEVSGYMYFLEQGAAISVKT
jgi:hypothetical protein